MHIVSNVEGTLGEKYDALVCTGRGISGHSVGRQGAGDGEGKARLYAGCVSYFSAAGEMDPWCCAPR